MTTKAKDDVHSLQKLLNTKKYLLKDVYCDLRELDRNRRRQKESQILELEPIPQTSTNFCKCSFEKTVGFENIVCVFVEVQNTSPSNHVLIEGRVFHSNESSISLLLDSNGDQTKILPPGAQGTLLVSFPDYILIGSVKNKVIIRSSWISRRPAETTVSPWLMRQLQDASDHPPESCVVVAPNPKEWINLGCIESYTEKEARFLLVLSSVCFHSRRFPERNQQNVREIFPKFLVHDFGYWQLLIGTEEFSGLIVGPSSTTKGTLDCAYGKTLAQLDTMVAKLAQTDKK